MTIKRGKTSIGDNYLWAFLDEDDNTIIQTWNDSYPISFINMLSRMGCVIKNTIK